MDSAASADRPLSLFYSYSHRDEAFRRELGSHLSILQRTNLIAEWHDRMIGAGDDWQLTIDRELAAADIMLLLVSSDFIASDYCWGEEMTKALARHEAGEARVIPVILRPCRWTSTPLARLQVVPKDGEPVSEWTSRDAAFDDIAAAVERTIQDLREKRRQAAEAARIAEEQRRQAEAEAKRREEEERLQREREAEAARRRVEAKRGLQSRLRRRAEIMPPRSGTFEAIWRHPLTFIAVLVSVAMAASVGTIGWRQIQQWQAAKIADAALKVKEEQQRQQAVEAEAKRRAEEEATPKAKEEQARQKRAEAWNDAIALAKTGKPSQSVKDCPDCPEMVVIPGGTFMMGSPASEQGRDTDESPQRDVTIKPFAMGKYEVTFDEWDACVAAGGCNGYRPDDRGWGRGSLPVTNVSWQDAQAYVDWLAKATGESYRLPTEAEWEYAARAGTRTPFSVPAPDGSTDIAKKGLANCYGCGIQGDLNGTAPVGSFPANAWGLYDMHGNVWEWVEDVRYGSYKWTPADGSTWVAGEGRQSSEARVIRGGSWNDYPKSLRSANRVGSVPGNRVSYLGFRVALTLAS